MPDSHPPGRLTRMSPNIAHIDARNAGHTFEATRNYKTQHTPESTANHITHPTIHPQPILVGVSFMKEKHNMADAQIRIDGRIAADPRFNSVNGKSVANIKVLAGRSKKNDDGTWENITTTAYDVAFWNQHAELVNMFNPNKGDSVVVTGTVTGIDKFQGEKGELLSVKVSG